MNIISELGYLQIFVLVLVFLVTVVSLRRRNRTQLNEPPLVPYKYPIIGHTFEYYKDVPGFLTKCHEEYGGIFSLYIWGKVQTYVGKEMHSEVFRNHQVFNFHAAMDDLAPINEFLGRPAGFLNGTGNFVKDFLVDITLFGKKSQENTIKAINDLLGEGRLVESPPLNVVTQIFSRAFAHVVVGEELCEDEEMLELLANVRHGLSSLVSFPPVLNFIHPNLNRKYLTFKFRHFDNQMKKDRKNIISKLTPVVNQRLKDRNRLGNSWERPDDMLQALSEKFEIDKNTVDVSCVADFIMSILFAAVHTTSIALLQCLCEYANYPEFHKEIIAEAEEIYNNNRDAPYLTVDEILKMEKLDNFVKESLRVNRHVVASQRKNISEQFTFSNGYQVPKGRHILINQHQVHFDPKTFGENPKKFNPSHHVNSPASRLERNFLAFSIGKFTCPGRILAVNEMKRILHFIILKFNIKSESGKFIEPKIIGGFLLPSSEGLIFEKRREIKF